MLCDACVKCSIYHGPVVSVKMSVLSFGVSFNNGLESVPQGVYSPNCMMNSISLTVNICPAKVYRQRNRGMEGQNIRTYGRWTTSDTISSAAAHSSLSELKYVCPNASISSYQKRNMAIQYSYVAIDILLGIQLEILPLK